MAQGGVSSGEFDIVSPADRFFEAIVGDMRGQNTEFEILTEDWRRKEVTFKIGGFLIPRSYEMALTTITVTSMVDKAGGSRVKWEFAFKKSRPDIVNPHFIIDLFISYLIERDENLDP